MILPHLISGGETEAGLGLWAAPVPPLPSALLHRVGGEIHTALCERALTMSRVPLCVASVLSPVPWGPGIASSALSRWKQ